MNDDFKRPLGDVKKQPVTPVVETSSPPQPPQNAPVVKEKKKNSKAFSFVSILLLLTLLGAGIMTYLWYNQNQDVDGLKNDNASLRAEADNLRTIGLTQKVTDDTTEAVAVPQEQQVAIAASTYFCTIKNFGCEKVDSKITKIQEQKTSQAGFAIVRAASATGGITNLYLKSIDGIKWTVIFDGQAKPPQTVVDRFEIPTEFVNAV